jgi:hypothetical protein
VTVPGFAVGVLLNALLDNARKVAVHTPAYAVFFLGLAAVLALTARLARAGRTRRAWWTGLPHPTGMEIFTIGDVTELDPFLFLVFTGLALGAILARGRQAAATHAA